MDINPLREAVDAVFAAVSASSAPAGSRVSSEELLDLIEDLGAVRSIVDAAVTVAMAQVAATEPVQCEDGTTGEQYRGLGHHRLDACDLVAARLRWSSRMGYRRVCEAIDLCTRTPALVTAMGHGRIDGLRAFIVSDETCDAPADVACQVIDALGDHLTTDDPGPLRTRTRKLLGAIAPDILAARVTAERQRRGLHRDTPAEGIEHWEAWYSTQDARPAWEAIDTLARAILKNGEAPDLPAARAAAHMQLLLGHTNITIHLHHLTPDNPAPETTDTTTPAYTARSSAPASQRIPWPEDGAARLVPPGASPATHAAEPSPQGPFPLPSPRKPKTPHPPPMGSTRTTKPATAPAPLCNAKSASATADAVFPAAPSTPASATSITSRSGPLDPPT